MTNQNWFNQIVKALQDGRPWEIHTLPLQVKQSFNCYACTKKAPEYEIIMGENGTGEPYWLGTSCLRKINKVLGYDIRKKQPTIQQNKETIK